MAALTGLGHRLMAGLALSLGLEESYFADHGTAEPLTLFRIFNYPPPADPTLWGVGEHTDYGLLTILLQDDAGGLEVKSRSRWVPAPPVPGSFVCNIGDMLDRMTGGLLPLDAPPRPQPGPARPALVPVLLRPQLLRPRPADRAAGPGPPARRPGRALGPGQRPRVRGDLRRLPARQGRQGLPRAAVGGALMPRAPVGSGSFSRVCEETGSTHRKLTGPPVASSSSSWSSDASREPDPLDQGDLVGLQAEIEGLEVARMWSGSVVPVRGTMPTSVRTGTRPGRRAGRGGRRSGPCRGSPSSLLSTPRGCGTG